MKITRRQLRKIIEGVVMRQVVAAPRVRGQGDPKAFSSGIYEEDEQEKEEIDEEE